MNTHIDLPIYLRAALLITRRAKIHLAQRQLQTLKQQRDQAEADARRRVTMTHAANRIGTAWKKSIQRQILNHRFELRKQVCIRIYGRYTSIHAYTAP